MKKWMFFLIGVLTGLVMAFLVYVLFFSNKKEKEVVDKTEVTEEKEDDETTFQSLEGVTLFDETGDVVNEQSFKVMQVVANDAALVHGKDSYGYYGMLYLLTNTDNKYYYDEEIINVPQSKVVRQIGVYKYFAKSWTTKTVPIIVMTDK